MEYGPNNTKLEELMKDPKREGELIEELRKSQLFLPVIYPENSFDIEGAKVGDVIQGPSGFNINYISDNKGNKAIPLFTSAEIMKKIGLRSSVIVMYVPDLANMLKGADRTYEFITINPLTENGVDIATVSFLKLFCEDYEEGEEISNEDALYQLAYENCKLYVRDINLPKELEEKYEIGALIREKAFVDMTDKIGQMTTSHRYAIISNHVGNLSEFEHETKWNLHTARPDSKFKVLDIYSFKEKTQILLLHIIESFELVYKNDNEIDARYIDLARKMFEASFEKEIIEEVNSSQWLERCSFPIGMDNEGNLWDLEDE